MQHFFISLLTVSVALSPVAPSPPKKYELRILALVPLTGKEPANGKSCSAALQVAVNAANRLKNFLPQYNIKLQIEDEARNAENSPTALFRFYNQDNLPQNTFRSPIVIGPSVTCHYAIFASKFINVLHFSQFCAGPLLSRRDILPNVYRIQIPGPYSVVVTMSFILQIGQWRQIAIFTYAGNVNEYMMGKDLQRMAVNNKVDVVYYSNEFDVTMEMLLTAKKRGARVITMIHLQVALCAKVLCYAHMAGMTAPRYFFIGLVFCSFTVENLKLKELPDGCTRDTLLEMLKITAWVGTTPIAMRSYGITNFGYDKVAFEKLLEDELNGTIATDSNQRHLCHDAAMGALMTLNESESRLVKNYNSTIREFMNDPSFISSVTNQSAVDLDFDGLRIGRIRYSKIHEIAYEEIWVMQITERGFDWLYRFHPKRRYHLMDNSEWLYDPKQYRYSINRNIRWRTNYGGPPKDLSNKKHVVQSYSFEVMVTVLVLSALGGLKTFALMIATFRNRGHQKIHIWTDLLVHLGCILLNASAVITVVGTFYESEILDFCGFKVLVAAISVGLINSIISSRTALIVKHSVEYAKAPPIVTPRHTREVMQNAGTRGVIRAISRRKQLNQSKLPLQLNWKRIDRICIWVSVGTTLLNAALTLAWAFVPDQKLHLVIKDTELVYQEVEGFYMYTTVFYCHSQSFWVWFIALLAIEYILLFQACYSIYSSLRLFGMQLVQPGELSITQFCVLNSITLLSAAFLISVIFDGNYYAQTTVIAFAQLVYAEITSLIWGSVILKPVIAKCVPLVQTKPNSPYSTPMSIRSVKAYY